MGIADNTRKEGGIKVKDINLVDALDVVLNKKAERFISNEFSGGLTPCSRISALLPR